MPLVAINGDLDAIEDAPSLLAPRSDATWDADGNFRRHHHNATAEPTAADDWTQGYAPGSLWSVVTPYFNNLWICMDASRGAATWKRVASGEESFVTWPSGSAQLSNEKPLLAGIGIDISWNEMDNKLILDAELATTSNAGVASFDSDDFTITGDEATVSLKNSYAAEDHDASHIRGGADEVDGDLLDIDYAEGNYTPATTGVATHVDHLAAHLEGIDNMLALLRRRQRVWCLENPAADDEYILCQVPDAVTIKRISYICIGAGSTCTLNLYEHSESSPESSGVAVLASAASVTTTLGSTTTFANASLDQYGHLRCKIVSVGGTVPTRVYVGVTLEIDKPT